MRTRLTTIVAALIAVLFGTWVPGASARVNNEQEMVVLRTRVADLEKKLARCCHGKVRLIAVAMLQYAADHDGRYPDRPSELVPYTRASGVSLFICPASDTELALGGDVSAEIDMKTSYVFVPGRTRQDLGKIVLYERDHNHGKMRSALYGDGHQEMVVDLGLDVVEAGN